MNDKFDELAKNLAQSVTRRGALKKFGVGIAGVVLASLGLPNKVGGDPIKNCLTDADCPDAQICSSGICAQTLHHCQCNNPPIYGCDRNPVGSQSYYDCV